MSAPLSKRPGRTITVGTLKWKWRMGRSYVIAYSEDGKKVCAPWWTVQRLTYGEVLLGKRHGPLTPVQVAAWLAREMAEWPWKTAT